MSSAFAGQRVSLSGLSGSRTGRETVHGSGTDQAVVHVARPGAMMRDSEVLAARRCGRSKRGGMARGDDRLVWFGLLDFDQVGWVVLIE